MTVFTSKIHFKNRQGSSKIVLISSTFQSRGSVYFNLEQSSMRQILQGDHSILYLVPKPSSQNDNSQFQRNEIPCGAGTVYSSIDKKNSKSFPINCKDSLINTFSNFKLLNKSISRHQKWITRGWGQLLKYLPHVIIPGVFQEISRISCSPGIVWGVNSIQFRGVSKSVQELFKRKKDSSVFIIF